jgi:dolichol kinase
MGEVPRWHHCFNGFVRGDGIADIVGEKLLGQPFPVERKTIAGSLAMFTGGFILPLVVLLVFVANGMWEILALIYHACFDDLFYRTLVETLPPAGWDNYYRVPFTAVSCRYLLL